MAETRENLFETADRDSRKVIGKITRSPDQKLVQCIASQLTGYFNQALGREWDAPSRYVLEKYTYDSYERMSWRSHRLDGERWVNRPFPCYGITADRWHQSLGDFIEQATGDKSMVAGWLETFGHTEKAEVIRKSAHEEFMRIACARSTHPDDIAQVFHDRMIVRAAKDILGISPD